MRPSARLFFFVAVSFAAVLAPPMPGYAGAGDRVRGVFDFERAGAPADTTLPAPAPHDTLAITAAIPYLGEYATGEAYVYLSDAHSVLTNPVVVVEGFDINNDMNWDELFHSNLEILSFDASRYDITKYPAYRNGKRIAWGVQSQEDVKDFRPGDLLTLPCGMGPKFHNPGDCDTRLRTLLTISANVAPARATLDSGPSAGSR